MQVNNIEYGSEFEVESKMRFMAIVLYNTKDNFAFMYAVFEYIEYLHCTCITDEGSFSYFIESMLESSGSLTI